ncbi:hypothetical protein WMF04_34240 [Sorangium sp. So ce260]|uniref:hypothetical protein n=1 Tax=Sorangium sp. So ce260 TaxID=3133291 RepID=UPI003F608518
MTAQFDDIVAYAGADWSLAGVNGGDLFDPASQGLRVRPASTACWRGFVCRYELRDNALYLDGLDVALEGEAPPLLGKVPREPEMHLGFTAAYEGIALHVPFSGGLLLARDFLLELYVHMGFHPAWKYAHVLEVELEAGRISRVTDCSKPMADIRSHVAGIDQPGPGSSHEEIQAWVERAFSRKY